jgi:WhiB family redox-sensing transcriptional regulator
MTTFLTIDTVDSIITREEWQDRAVCAQTDPEIFFPHKGGSTREAKKVCRGCEVREECLRYALDNDERFGIFGGLSERERRKLRTPVQVPGKHGGYRPGVFGHPQ